MNVQQILNAKKSEEDTSNERKITPSFVLNSEENTICQTFEPKPHGYSHMKVKPQAERALAHNKSALSFDNTRKSQLIQISHHQKNNISINMSNQQSSTTSVLLSNSASTSRIIGTNL
jgi:hypothetical protein